MQKVVQERRVWGGKGVESRREKRERKGNWKRKGREY